MKKINKISKLFILAAMASFILSAVSFFIPILTPPKNLSVPGKTTFSEFLADLSFFLFFAGSLLVAVNTFVLKHENQ